MTDSVKTSKIDFFKVRVTGRANAMFEYFGPACTLVEPMIFDNATKMLAGYIGGSWEMYLTSNGGLIMVPPVNNSEKCELSNPDNYSTESLSAMAAGLVLTIFAVNHAWHSKPESRLLKQAWKVLMEVVYQHEEAQQMLAILD